MEWAIAGIAVILLIRWILKERGNLEFWKLANKEQHRAYHLFSSNSAWMIVNNDPSSNVPRWSNKKWDGPFKFRSPDGSLMTIYGKVGAYESTQEEFMESSNGKAGNREEADEYYKTGKEDGLKMGYENGYRAGYKEAQIDKSIEKTNAVNKQLYDEGLKELIKKQKGNRRES
jgi:flagellar biosynthesis/type III secretory pathway protein FliH